jgi:hypothetical protein
METGTELNGARRRITHGTGAQRRGLPGRKKRLQDTHKGLNEGLSLRFVLLFSNSCYG